MGKGRYIWIVINCLTILSACSFSDIKNYQDIETYPDIFPDYTDVTVPYNISPLNFCLQNDVPGIKGILKIEGKNSLFEIHSSNKKFLIPPHKWEKLLKENKGDSIKLTVFVKQEEWKKYKSFLINISPDPIDPYLVYRLIEPGYKLWGQMGIYQRNLGNFRETALYENKMTDNNCVNCHTFCQQNPNEMLFHMRGTTNGTLLINNGIIEKLNIKTDSIISSLVYPCWHPSGRFLAFSVNLINQVFYLNNRNRIEVYDSKSDIVIYDHINQEIFTSPLLSDKNILETFPGFSPDGKKLYFCSAKPFSVPNKSDSVKYSLCSISFSQETKAFSEKVDTIFNAEKANKSASFPRISPDGRYLLFTVCDYGSFPIWHKESDLFLLDLKTNKYINLNKVNSQDVDSYHSWSSNSRWFVFSSRRVDGLYTRPYIAFLDKEGNVGKAFMLPQKDPAFYHTFMKSYNIPEFVKDKVKIDSYMIANQMK